MLSHPAWINTRINYPRHSLHDKHHIHKAKPGKTPASFFALVVRPLHSSPTVNLTTEEFYLFRCCCVPPCSSCRRSAGSCEPAPLGRPRILPARLPCVGRSLALGDTRNYPPFSALLPWRVLMPVLAFFGQSFPLPLSAWKASKMHYQALWSFLRSSMVSGPYIAASRSASTMQHFSVASFLLAISDERHNTSPFGV